MISDPEPDRWTEIAPVIDRAMAQLDGSTRDMLLMRYFQGKSVQEVATATGLSVDAAQKRLSRAPGKVAWPVGKERGKRRGIGGRGDVVGAIGRSGAGGASSSILATAGSGNAPSSLADQIVKQIVRWRRLRHTGNRRGGDGSVGDQCDAFVMDGRFECAAGCASSESACSGCANEC